MGTFRLPDLGEGLAEAEILEWHVKVGDRVRLDQPMVSVETAKAVVEVPVPFGGIVTALHGAVGDIVATGAPLIDFDSGTVVGTLPVTSEAEFVEQPSPVRPAEPGTRVRAVPAARALAKSLGLDLSSITGSGSGGLVKLQDVLAQANLGTPTGGVRAQAAAIPPDALFEPLRGARRAMAHSMSVSRDHVSGSTVCDDADIHGWATRGDYMLRLVRAVIAGCGAEPSLNAWYDAEAVSRSLQSAIDLAIAVDTPGGLIVPVLRNVEARTPAELRAMIASQKAAAHARSIPPQDLRSFTLMLSNFGTLAGRYGTPLVVPPAVAILGAGRVRLEPVVADGSVVAHRRMPLSLTFDHRCITGGEACRFLAAVIADLEQPD